MVFEGEKEFEQKINLWGVSDEDDGGNELFIVTVWIGRNHHIK